MPKVVNSVLKLLHGIWCSLYSRLGINLMWQQHFTYLCEIFYSIIMLSTHQRTRMWPHHSTAASVTLAASPETSGVQDCTSCTPVASFSCTDLPANCNHCHWETVL